MSMETGQHQLQLQIDALDLIGLSGRGADYCGTIRNSLGSTKIEDLTKVKAGDLVIFGIRGHPNEHIGIVEGVECTYVEVKTSKDKTIKKLASIKFHTIEGNTGYQDIETNPSGIKTGQGVWHKEWTWNADTGLTNRPSDYPVDPDEPNGRRIPFFAEFFRPKYLET